MRTTVAMLLGIFLLSPFLVKANPVTASSAVAAPSPSLYLPLVMRPVAAPIPSVLYLPLVMRNFPLQTLFGAEMDQLTSGGGLDQMAAANISWTRRNAVLWSSVKPTEGTYNWGALSGLESELQNASEKGMRVILIVRSTPQWARKIAGSGPYCGPIHPDKLPAFGSFMHELVARYSVPPYNVKYWELWNEPDIDPSIFGYGDSIYGCWGDQSDSHYGGGYYAEMLKAAYPQIKAADPQAQVLVGGLLLDCDPRGSPSVCASLTPPHNDKPPKFLEGILRNDGGAYFDGVGFHGYDDYYGALGRYGSRNWNSGWNISGPTTTARARFIMEVLDTYHIYGKFIMNTETAIICGGFNDPPGQPPCESEPTSPFEQTKAYYIAQVYAAAIAEGLRANIWYSVLGWRNSGLLRSDLTLPLKTFASEFRPTAQNSGLLTSSGAPRPAYYAYQFARSELMDASFVGDIGSADIGGVSGVKGYKFNRGDRTIWLLWSLDGSSHDITFSSAPLAVWDALGNSVTPATSMNVDLKPLYLEWNP